MLRLSKSARVMSDCCRDSRREESVVASPLCTFPSVLGTEGLEVEVFTSNRSKGNCFEVASEAVGTELVLRVNACDTAVLAGRETAWDALALFKTGSQVGTTFDMEAVVFMGGALMPSSAVNCSVVSCFSSSLCPPMATVALAWELKEFKLGLLVEMVVPSLDEVT